MNLIRASLDCSKRIDDAESAILMTVPIESDIAALFFDDAFHESHDGACAVRS
ncbi:hypothetical protein D3C83_308400 [compost metagenome]